MWPGIPLQGGPLTCPLGIGAGVPGMPKACGQGCADRSIASTCWSLEEELCPQLNQTWRTGADGLAKGGTADIAVNGLRPEELRVIENVERFEAELEGF